MLRLILTFVDIAFHRRGPEELPASRFLLTLALVAYSTIGLAVLRIADRVQAASSSDAARSSLSDSVVFLLFDTVPYLAFLWVVLRAAGRVSRFIQTASAVYGAHALLNFLSLPPVLWSARGPASAGLAMPDVMLLVLYVWSIDIAGFVLSRAIDRPYVACVAIMVGYVLLSESLRVVLFPAPG